VCYTIQQTVYHEKKRGWYGELSTGVWTFFCQGVLLALESLKHLLEIPWCIKLQNESSLLLYLDVNRRLKQ